MYLYIDTTEKESFDIALLDRGSVIKKKRVKSIRKHSEKLLKSIDMMLKSEKARLKDILGILVVRGPGSFTSLRIGIATANALAYGLQVSIKGIDKDQDLDDIASLIKKSDNIVIPEYGREPDIK